MITKTLEDVQREVRELIADRKDYVYESPHGWTACYYIYGGQPSCLVGQYLSSIGIPNSGLLDMEDVGEFAQDGDRGTEIVLQEHGIEMDDAAMHWLGDVQSKQDRKVPWGEAVEYADSQIGTR